MQPLALHEYIDQSRLLLGGRQCLSPMADLEIHTSWSGPILSSGDEPWPCFRSLHTAVCLLDPDVIDPPRDDGSQLLEQKLLAYIWGANKVSDQIDDIWILLIKQNLLKWEPLHLPNGT